MEPKKPLFRPVTPNGPLRISPIRLTEGSSTKCRAVLGYLYVKLLTNHRVVSEMTENSLTEQILPSNQESNENLTRAHTRKAS